MVTRPATTSDLLGEHVMLDVECLDRIYPGTCRTCRSTGRWCCTWRRGNSDNSVSRLHRSEAKQTIGGVPPTDRRSTLFG
jgi:hypothetical protein